MIAIIVAVALAALAIGLILGCVFTVRWMDRRHVAELERMGNMLTVGTPVVPAGEIISQQPDAIARTQARISAETVAEGVRQLRERYKERGLSITEEEAELQVRAMLLGNPPV